jgi:AcrR family transcriptional regulator
MATRRSSRSLPADPDAARSYLLAAAESCFETYGIGRTTMEDIAESAAVSRPTLYRYFGDRDSLIRAIVRSRSSVVASYFQRHIQRYGSLGEQITEGLLWLADQGRRDQFMRALMRPETIELANQLLMDEGGSGESFAAEVWEPVLSVARDAGHLRSDIDLTRAYHWLTSLNFMLISWLDLEDQPLGYFRQQLADFVVPGFIAD